MKRLAAVLLLTASVTCAQDVDIHQKTGKWLRGEIVATSNNGLHMSEGNVHWSDMDTVVFRSYRVSDSSLVRRLESSGVLVIGAAENKSFNFIIENGDAVWKYVYLKNGDNQAKLKRKLLANPYVKNIVVSEGSITADLSEWQIDYRKAGAKWATTDIGIVQGKWNGRIIIEFKEAKYRTIVSGLNFDAGSIGAYGGGIMVNTELASSWAEWTLNKRRTDFKRNQDKNRRLMDIALYDLFVITGDNTEEDW